MTIKTHKRFAKTITSYFRSKPLRVVFAVLWVLFVGLIISAGFEQSPHSFDMYSDNSSEPYQTGLVVFLIAAMMLHLILLFVSDFLMHDNWKFCVMLLITIPFLLYFGMGAMHAPPSLVLMIMWTLLSFLIFLVLCFCQVCLFVLRNFFDRT